MSAKPLPPYGGEYLKSHPDPGVVVAVGRGAWEFSRRSGKPVMVLRSDAEPADYRWPTNGQPALIHELGEPDDNRLAALARALLAAGAPSVVALRHALVDASSDCRVFFESDDHVA